MLRWRDSLTGVASAGELLGIAGGAFEDLVTHGFVEPASGPDVDGFSSLMFTRDALASACERFDLRASARPARCRCPEGRHTGVDVATVSRVLAAYGVSLADFVARIVRGEVGLDRAEIELYIGFLYHFAVCEGGQASAVGDAWNGPRGPAPESADQRLARTYRAIAASLGRPSQTYVRRAFSVDGEDTIYLFDEALSAARFLTWARYN